MTTKAGCWVAALLLALTGSSPPFALAWGGPSVKHDRVHQVELLEQQWRSAVLAGDATAMDRMLSDDYVSITMQGKVNTKSQQLRRMRDRLFVLERMDLSNVKIRVSGEVAIVTGRASILGQSSGLSLEGSYRYTQVLHLLPDGWTITNFEAQPMSKGRLPLLSLQHASHAS